MDADRVASAAADVVFPGHGAVIMAVAIMISTFGCNNGLILAGARAYYAMARDGLFFRRVGELNKNHVPAWGLIIQGIWAGALVLPRTVKTDAAGIVTGYGNLYGNLLDYVISAALIFYVLTIMGIFMLRWKRPGGRRTRSSSSGATTATTSARRKSPARTRSGIDRPTCP